VRLDIIARGSPGFSGADLANLVNEAALLAARRNHDAVEVDDFEEAKDKIMLGIERRSVILTEDEIKTTAYHEAGHALVSWLIPGSDPIHKVTIIPRGHALGVTHFLPADERHNYPKQYWLDTLTHLLGGRGAEELVFSEITTGSAQDIDYATEIARRMVCEWGMSDALGPVTFGKEERHIFLGRELARPKEYSEATAVLIDQEIRGLIEWAMDRARKLLADNVDKLRLLAEALLDHETLTGAEVDELFGEGAESGRAETSGATSGQDESPEGGPETAGAPSDDDGQTSNG
jgi:cell division protease FtsH